MLRIWPIHAPPLVEHANRNRGWMDETPGRFAYHCLPLVVANEMGVVVKLPGQVKATWDGGVWPHALQVEGHGAGTHFGSGIVTFNVDAIVRTDPGTQTLVMGPANEPKDGAHALVGLVETDWADATFTMNWQLTRPGTVVWEAGEVIAQLVPVQMAAMKAEQLVVEDMPEATRTAYRQWAEHRSQWPGGKRQLHYRRGVGVDSPGAKEKGCEHFTSMRGKHGADSD